jgi:PAS domain S-box-containing protein
MIEMRRGGRPRSAPGRLATRAAWGLLGAQALLFPWPAHAHADEPAINYLLPHAHGSCLGWRPLLLGLHVGSDALTALAYYSIPVALLVFVRRRRDLQFSWMFVLFSLFILACGTTHVMAIWTLWEPAYLSSGIIKAATAVLSVFTAVILWPLIPKALALPGPAQWEVVNQELRNEVAERREAEAEVRRLNAELEQRVAERTAELEAANRKLDEANRELREKEARIRRLFESDIIGIIFWDLQGGITDANDAFLSMVGFSREELLSGKVLWTQLTPPEHRPADALATEELRTTGSFRPFEKEYLRRDGSRVPVLVGGSFFEGSRDKGVAFVLDLTEHRRAEGALQTAREELVRQEKLAILGQLSGSVGHELRNPLGVMSNAVYFLKMVFTDADETTKEYLGIIEHEIANSLRIITDLLDFARTKPPQKAPVAAAELVRQSLGKCAVPPNVAVSVELPEALPTVSVDPLQIGQVLVNFITNAVQAMPGGGALEIAARRVRGTGNEERGVEAHNLAPRTSNLDPRPSILAPDGDFVEISVTDTGEGIPPENLKKLFQPLFTTKPKGIGLGLVVCKNLVTANGGRIAVASEVGKGTTFAVVLPVKSDADEATREV